MKTFTLLLALMMIFSTSAVFACGGPCDKDKDDAALTVDVEYLCGGGCTKPKPAPKPEPEPEPTCGQSGTCDKDKKPAPKPECGKDCTCKKCSKDTE